MTKQYRLKLMAKGQMTAPSAMRLDLHLNQGDELEVFVEDGRIVGAQVLKPIPAELFTPELLKELEQREKRFDDRRAHQSVVEELREQVIEQSKRELHGRKTHSPVR
jgi:AbrB family looped-hinge helix DNA binding protein